MSWIDDLYAAWMPAPKEQPWTPTYEPQQYVYSLSIGGADVAAPINLFYFATEETAEHLKVKYGAAIILKLPFEGAGGPNWATASVRELVWPNGVVIHAGLLASLWTQNAANPDVAHALTLEAIRLRGAR